ncbi:MAG TPA: MFS transporter, partial [Bacteroidia bacterium]|nr:MFS transporter [Bacteroidia bacterium]
MKKFETLTSAMVPLNIEDIDTDQIIPARFLKATTREGFGKNLFSDWRYDEAGNPKTDFILNDTSYNGLGGEYGGAAIYVAEHAPANRRGFYTSWIQTMAAGGLLLSLGVIAGTRWIVGEEAFTAWGWRIPFLLSAFLLLISVWVRLSLDESPVFRRM